MRISSGVASLLTLSPWMPLRSPGPSVTRLCDPLLAREVAPPPGVPPLRRATPTVLPPTMRHTTRWRRTIVVQVLGTLIASAAWAGEQPAPLPLEAVLAEARTRNPEIQAARERAGALASLPAQAAAWDDPTLSWEAWNAPDSFRLDHADNNIFRVSQK